MTSLNDADSLGDGLYGCISAAVGAITFFVAWAYAIARFGWFLGLGLGWFPAGVIALLMAVLWPLLVLAGIILYLVGRQGT